MNYTHTDGTIYGTGAIVTDKHPDVPTVGRASSPFDWTTVFQVPELVTKDQGQSSSCGGQATAYREEVSQQFHSQLNLFIQDVLCRAEDRGNLVFGLL